MVIQQTHQTRLDNQRRAKDRDAGLRHMRGAGGFRLTRYSHVGGGRTD